MKKTNLATTHSHSGESTSSKCELAVAGHEHLHAANCGHKSYVHAGHICYEHEGHFHYMHDGHAHECPGPKVQPMIARNTSTMPTTPAKSGSVTSMAAAKAKRG